MQYSEEVKKLAETLKSSGLSASMNDALEKAQSMLGKKEAEKEEPRDKEEYFEKTTDTAQTTLGEVKEADEKETIEEPVEIEDELKEEEVFTNKPEQQNIEQKKEDLPNQKKVDYSKEKKLI